LTNQIKNKLDSSRSKKR